MLYSECSHLDAGILCSNKELHITKCPFAFYITDNDDAKLFEYTCCRGYE